jgi:DNA-binding NarL/FixJ family response regulator
MLVSCPSFQRPSLPRPFKVAVVDDHPLLRRGIVDLLRDTPGLRCCGESDSIAGALALVRAEQPDLATIDLSLGLESGFPLIRNILVASPATRILVVSMHDERVFAARALRAGASGYLMKDQAPQELLKALCRLVHGKTYLSEEAAELILSTVGGRHGEHDPVASFGALSEREHDVLDLIAHGLSTREIGDQLGVSVKTVETHCAHLKDKLGLRSARELLRYAVMRTADSGHPLDEVPPRTPDDHQLEP